MGDLCDKLVDRLLFKTTVSWIFESNVKGRKSSTKFYFGGLNKYREWARTEVKKDFRDLSQASKIRRFETKLSY